MGGGGRVFLPVIVYPCASPLGPLFCNNITDKGEGILDMSSDLKEQIRALQFAHLVMKHSLIQKVLACSVNLYVWLLSCFFNTIGIC